MPFAGGPPLDPCLVLHHGLQAQKRSKAVTMTLASDEREKWYIGLPPRRTVQVGSSPTFPSCGCLSELGNAQKVHTLQHRSVSEHGFGSSVLSRSRRVNQDIAA
jgi:hypothetical protein